MKWEEYIRDKHIAFIGPSPIMVGRKLGEIIDRYDIVVKTNGAVDLESLDYYRDYGKRIDVLYTNNQFYREMTSSLTNLKEKGVKFLRMKTCKPEHLKSFNQDQPTEIINRSMIKVNSKVTSPLMGCYIITDLLDHAPASLTLYGFDFYNYKKEVFEHDNYQEYIEGYLPKKIRDQGNIINIGKTKDSHDRYSNSKYIYDLYKQGKVLMPSFILDELKRAVKC